MLKLPGPPAEGAFVIMECGGCGNSEPLLLTPDVLAEGLELEDDFFFW